ncbi:MAG TPA: anaerobic ribonucleoside-triphosphate reductase activating protein [Ramlibacter sp.]|nr:anaerobic ribonucleoside-triphosphate reductase activating protein [Ramlibacter sp.]
MTPALRVGGLTALTSIDFPGRLAAVVFLQGCPWRCSYCQNPGLIAAEAPAAMSWHQVRAFLQRRRGLLDAVVFSGGEPTLQAGLGDAVRDVRELGFEVGLHSAGMYPERLAAVLPSLDWIGLDIKAPPEEYDAVTGVPGSGAKARASLAHVLHSGIAYECRTTWHEGLFALEQLRALAQELAGLGVTHWSVQSCRADGRPQAAPPAAELIRMGEQFSAFCLR